MPETELRCRDDACLKVEALLQRGGADYYVPANRQRFLREIIGAGGNDVLRHYVTLLKQHCGGAPASPVTASNGAATARSPGAAGQLAQPGT